MRKEPLVTIAIPAYKKKYLAQAIESALNQTYRNIELVIVNDQSQEDIDSVVTGFKDGRIRYYTNPQNLGRINPAHNWNQCLSYARGEYFALLCDDDLYEPEFVESLLDLAGIYPQTHVFRVRADIIDHNGTAIDWYPSEPEWESTDDYMWHVFKRCRKQTISEFMYRTQRLKDCQGYASLPLAWHADYLSVFRFSTEGGIATANKILMHFRQSGLNISSQDDKNILEKLQATRLYIEKVKPFFNHLPERQQHIITYLMYAYLKVDIRYMLNHTPKKTILKIASAPKTYGVAGITTKSLLWRAFWHKRKANR